MVQQRPFPTDKPLRGTFWRKGIIAARHTAYVYTVDFYDPIDPTEPAFYSGFDLIDPGVTVICTRSNEAATWRITEVLP